MPQLFPLKPGDPLEREEKPPLMWLSPCQYEQRAFEKAPRLKHQCLDQTEPHPVAAQNLLQASQKMRDNPRAGKSMFGQASRTSEPFVEPGSRSEMAISKKKTHI